MGISVMLLAYKEEENLRVLFPKLKKAMEEVGEEYELIVIDTKEPMDHTKELCEEVGAKYYNQEEPGFGGAYRKGIQVAAMDKMLALDSDGSHNPEAIPAIYKKFVEGYDVVIGSRYVKGGQTADAKSSQIMSWMLNTAYRVCLGISAKDISTNFRITRRNVWIISNYTPNTNQQAINPRQLKNWSKAFKKATSSRLCWVSQVPVRPSPWRTSSPS